MSTTPTPEGVSDEQIIELAYQHLCYWNEDHIRFARAVLALSSSARDQEGVRYEREAYRVFMDGNQWCAVGPAFIDLQQSPAGFADTPYLALERLTEAEGEDMRRALRAADWKDAPAAIRRRRPTINFRLPSRPRSWSRNWTHAPTRSRATATRPTMA